MKQFQQYAETTKIWAIAPFLRLEPHCLAKEAKKRLKYCGICRCSTRYCKNNQKTNPKDRKVLDIYIYRYYDNAGLAEPSFFFFLLSGRIMKLKFTAALLLLQLSPQFIIAYSSNIWD